MNLGYLIIIIIIIIIFPQYFANDFENRKEECLDLLITYKVIPGFTWGLAKEDVQFTYAKLSCDSFLIPPPLDTFQVNESLQMIMAENAKFNSTVFFRQGDSGSILCEINQSHDLKIQSKVLIVIYQEMRSFHIAIQYIKLNIINVLLDENVGVSLALCFRSTAHYERDIEDIYRALNQFGVMEYIILVKFISIVDEERIVRTLDSSITRNNIVNNPKLPLLRQYAQRYLVGLEIRNLISNQVLLGESYDLIFFLRSDAIISYLKVHDLFPMEKAAVMWAPFDENWNGVNDRVAIFTYCGFFMYAAKLLNATITFFQNGGQIHGETMHKYILSSNAPIEIRRVSICYGVFRQMDCKWTDYGDADCFRVSRKAVRDDFTVIADDCESQTTSQIIYDIQNDCTKKTIHISSRAYGFGSTLDAFMMQAVVVWIHGMRVEFTPTEDFDAQKALYDPQFCASISNNTLHCIFRSLAKRCVNDVHPYQMFSDLFFAEPFDRNQYISAYKNQILFREKLSTPVFWTKIFKYLFSPRTEFEELILSVERTIKKSVPNGPFVCVHMRGEEKGSESKVYSFQTYVNVTLTLIQPTEHIFIMAESKKEEHLFEQNVGDFQVFKYSNASQRYEGSPVVHMAHMLGQIRHCGEARVIICTLSSNIGRLLVYHSYMHGKSPNISNIDGKEKLGTFSLEDFYPTRI